MILWRTGVRISEALELRPHDVDFQNGAVRVRLGKGLKPRTTVLSDLDALPLIELWLEERGKLQAVGQGAPLLCTLRGTPTDPSYARHLLPRLAKRAGLERRVHPHGLRHTHAADLALAGVPVLAHPAAAWAHLPRHNRELPAAGWRAASPHPGDPRPATFSLKRCLRNRG